VSGGRSRAARALRALAVAAVMAAGVLAAVALLRAPAEVRSTAAPAPATAPLGRLESMFQDDRELIYSSTPTVTHSLDLLRSLGVDRLRLTILWAAIAPSPQAGTAPPGFDATDPAAYPPGAWAPYDRVLRLARARGIGVDFDVTAPGPRWAMRARPPSEAATEADHYEPSAADFGAFVRALGRRYGGGYRPPGASRPLPRVGFWSIWNEPNQPGWLAPQTSSVDGRPVITAARLDRSLIDAATAALRGTGHGADTILIGELAPEGDPRPGPGRPVAPLPFLRALYCVDAAARPLTGGPARALGCPADGARTAFVAAHPGLFAATGFAHHPYAFLLAPAVSMTDPDFAPLADLSRLEQALDGIFAADGVNRRLPIYLTEYGYETDPPNPYRGVPPATQAAYLDEGAYLAWRDPRVRSLSQFLLRDSPPDGAYPRGSVRYWSTFQTGLEYLDGRPKPALHDYRVAIFTPVNTFARAGAVTVWGMLRAARLAMPQSARVQWRARGPAQRWRTLTVARTADPSGVFTAAVRPPRTGLLRIAWTAPGGRVDVSRSASVTGG
jgi:hypothetical protein